MTVRPEQERDYTADAFDSVKEAQKSLEWIVKHNPERADTHRRKIDALKTLVEELKQDLAAMDKKPVAPLGVYKGQNTSCQ